MLISSTIDFSVIKDRTSASRFVTIP